MAGLESQAVVVAEVGHGIYAGGRAQEEKG